MGRNILEATIFTILKGNLRERDYRQGTNQQEIENATFSLSVKAKIAGM